jgi:hypothetical protein
MGALLRQYCDQPDGASLASEDLSAQPPRRSNPPGPAGAWTRRAGKAGALSANRLPLTGIGRWFRSAPLAPDKLPCKDSAPPEHTTEGGAVSRPGHFADSRATRHAPW